MIENLVYWYLIVSRNSLRGKRPRLSNTSDICIFSFIKKTIECKEQLRKTFMPASKILSLDIYLKINQALMTFFTFLPVFKVHVNWCETNLLSHYDARRNPIFWWRWKRYICQKLLLNHSSRGSKWCLDIVVGFFTTIQSPYSHIHHMHQIFL